MYAYCFNLKMNRYITEMLPIGFLQKKISSKMSVTISMEYLKVIDYYE